MEIVTALTYAQMEQTAAGWYCRVVGPEGETIAETTLADRMAAWLWCEQQMEAL